MVCSDQVSSTTDGIHCYVTEANNRLSESSPVNSVAENLIPIENSDKLPFLSSTKLEHQSFSSYSNSGAGKYDYSPYYQRPKAMPEFLSSSTSCNSYQDHEKTSPGYSPSSTPANSSLLLSMDQTGGPEGPPNVTWLSSSPLENVKAFFERSPSFSVSERSHESDRSEFIDQTQFLTEQASILHGRNDFSSASNSFETIKEKCNPSYSFTSLPPGSNRPATMTPPFLTEPVAYPNAVFHTSLSDPTLHCSGQGNLLNHSRNVGNYSPRMRYYHPRFHRNGSF